ncbi:MAG: HNH endonuclease [Dehalococcoidia bacterium]
MTFSEDEIEAVWAKGTVAPNNDPNVFRKDACGAWIRRASHGDHDADLGFGWDIDHIVPESEGGTDGLSNLRPLQWKNNAARGADELECMVTSAGTENVFVE